MSLAIWLPLLGNLNNYGLSELTITSGTAKYKTGKIGQGLDISSRLAFNCSKLNGCKQFSVAFWVKIEDDSSITTNWQDIVDLADQTADNSNIGTFRAETCYSTGNNYYGVHWHDNQINAICNIPSNLAHYNNTDRGIWKHCVMTCDTNSFIKIYTDGNYIMENTVNMNGGHLTGNFRLGNNGNIVGCLNDLRIYDYILSPREVKEISKGLVLHYKLDRGGFGADNLLVPQISDAKWTDWSASTTWSSENTREKIVDESGKTWAHIIQNSSTGYGGYACAPNNNEIIIDPTKKYVISALAKSGTKENSRLVFWCHWRSTEGGGNLSQDQTYCELTSTPKRVYAVWTPNGGTSEYTPNRINLNIGTYGLANNEVYFTDVKFEEGEVPTPWIPNSSDSLYSSMGLNDNIVYDVSGYGHNGELYTTDNTASFNYESNSPRYTMAINPHSINPTTSSKTGTAYIRGDCQLTTPNQMTIAFWCYARNSGYTGGTTQGVFCTTANTGDDIGVDYITSAMNHRDGAVDINNPNGSTHLRLSIVFTANEWHHYAFTYDGQNAKSYRDGVLQDTKSFSAETALGSFSSVVLGLSRAGGVWRRNDNTYSDLRVYATCLSADDINVIYQIPISLSSDGTLFAGEYVEG